jgi:hypothetical protein
MHTATTPAAAEARVSHVSRLCAVLSGPGVKRPLGLGGEVALLPFAHTCHINARGSTIHHSLVTSPWRNAPHTEPLPEHAWKQATASEQKATSLWVECA